MFVVHCVPSSLVCKYQIFFFTSFFKFNHPLGTFDHSEMHVFSCNILIFTFKLDHHGHAFHHRSSAPKACLTVLFQGQDDHLLESPNCIRFLIKLLKPAVSMSDEDKAPKIGRKLLSSCNVPGRDKMKGLNSSYIAIVSKVQEVLVSCKELKSSCADDSGIGRTELCPKWIALLTMEKACLTTVSLEGNVMITPSMLCMISL